MKSVFLALAALAATTVAQSWPPWYDVQSKGFRLILKSTDRDLDGHALGACHQGLCLTGETVDDPAGYSTTFYHNVSSHDDAAANADDTAGVLNWVLGANGGALSVPSAMRFVYLPGSNLANMIFMPGYDEYTLLYFEAGCNSMYIDWYSDDTVTPPSYHDPSLKLENWYVCLTRYSYEYTTLVWKVGITGEPQNPSCKKVDVERVWV